MIKAIDFVKTGFSVSDAEKMNSIIKPLFEQGDIITVDFEGITIFTTLFFNNVFAKYLMQIGPEKYNDRFVLINLSELGTVTYQHSIDNAINFYNLSEGDKKDMKDILENPED